MRKDLLDIKDLGALKASGYKSRSIKQEMRENLILTMRNGSDLFSGLKGYEESVIPQLQAALLSRHNILFLGLRGQAKTRIARSMVALLDEYMPVVEGSELNDDPLAPLSMYARDLVRIKGDATPIAWVHRSERYTEKLATPDVSVADLIGDLDPIKAATLKLSYADEGAIHYGLIPRSNRSIFVINELPDLQARIQVSLFNILQEGDIQIRGFKLRLPLDIQFVFTANPEDYTNRGAIVTPLKDRIESQILTHYPKSVEISAQITAQEAKISHEQQMHVKVPDLVKELIERIAFEARQSDYVDQKSGISARLTISALELLYSNVERRLLINGEKNGTARVADLYGVIPAITGKVELVYEGEVEGISNVAFFLIGKAIRSKFINVFPDPEKTRKEKANNVYKDVIDWFNTGQKLDLLQNMPENAYQNSLESVTGLMHLVSSHLKTLLPEEKHLLMEFALHGLAEYSQLSKHRIDNGLVFKDLMSSMFSMEQEIAEDDLDDIDDDYDEDDDDDDDDESDDLR